MTRDTPKVPQSGPGACELGADAICSVSSKMQRVVGSALEGALTGPVCLQPCRATNLVRSKPCCTKLRRNFCM